MNHKFTEILIKASRLITALFLALCVVVGLLIYMVEFYTPPRESIVVENKSGSQDNTHSLTVSSELIVDNNVELVIANCTSCHSEKMIIQNRATKEGWISMIRWMQKTQNLWDLGTNEDKIVEYLAKNYSPEKKGRRAQLTGVEWYELESK